MSNLLADKRAEIATALDAVLPDGRFTPYPRTMTRLLAPAGWVEQPSGSVAESRIVATFPVWFVYDGSDEAQVAGLDDLIANAWAALSRVAQVHPRRWRPATLPVTATQNNEPVTIHWRAVVIDVEATMLAQSFCAPTVTPALVPPELVRL